VENQRAPIAMLALARVGVLVEGGAVEIHETMRVFGKMRRYPIDEHGDSLLVAAVHQIHEIFRRAETRRRSIAADQLVSPRAGKRMLHDGQELQVCIAHLLDVSHQVLRQHAVTEELSVRTTQPALKMDLI